jgi:hypothetical protein
MNFNLQFGRTVRANGSYPDTSFVNGESSSHLPQDLGNTHRDQIFYRMLSTQYDIAFHYKNNVAQ